MEAFLGEHAAGTGAPGPGVRSPIRREFLAETLNRHPDYFVFAFVRNPFDRVVSTWRHGLRGTGSYWARPVRELSLAEYVRIAAERRVEEQSPFDRYHLLPQVEFIPGPSRRTLFGVPLAPEVTCAFIGRFERLEADFREACRRAGIVEGPLAQLNAGHSAPAGRHDGWREHLDPATKAVVRELYREDFASFGYDAEDDAKDDA